MISPCVAIGEGNEHEEPDASAAFHRVPHSAAIQCFIDWNLKIRLVLNAKLTFLATAIWKHADDLVAEQANGWIFDMCANRLPRLTTRGYFFVLFNSSVTFCLRHFCQNVSIVRWKDRQWWNLNQLREGNIGKRWLQLIFLLAGYQLFYPSLRIWLNLTIKK